MKTEPFFRELLLGTWKNHYQRLGDNPTDEQVQEAMKIELAKQSKEIVIDMLSDIMMHLSNDSAFEVMTQLSEEVSEAIANGESKPGG